MFFRKKRPDFLHPELEPTFHHRIVVTALLVLFFRLLANIRIANVDEARVHELLARNPLVGALDLFAGGDVLSGFSIVAVGLFPYLAAAGAVRLAARFIPALRFLEQKGREKLLKLCVRATTVPVAVVFAWGIQRYLALETGLFPSHLVWFTRSTFGYTVLVVGAATAGSLITETIKDGIQNRGIGAGASVILLVGSSLSLVTWFSDLIYSGKGSAAIARELALFASAGLVVVVLSIPLLGTVRKIPITLAKRRLPGRTMAEPQIYMPLKINSGGVTPILAAVGTLMLFQFAAMALEWAFPGRFVALEALLLAPTKPDRGLYWALLAILIFGFTYVSNYSVLWKPDPDSDITLAEMMRRNTSSYVTGVRPGEKTAEYLSRVMTAITAPAAVTLTFLAAGLPYLVLRLGGPNSANSVLAEIVFVKAFLDVRFQYDFHKTMDRAYDRMDRGFLHRGLRGSDRRRGLDAPPPT